MKLSKHSGTTVRDSLKPSTSASFTQAISWSATCSVRADDGRLAAAEHEPVDQLAPGPARAERGGNSLYIGANRLSGTRLVAAEIDTKRGSGVCQGTFDTGVAPILRQKLADILFGAGVDEHALGVAGGEYAATIGGARLVQHRRMLRRWLPQQHGVDTKLLSLVAHQVHPAWIGVDAPAAIAHYRVVCPATLPQRVDHLKVFVRQVVPVVMLHLHIEAH